MYTPQTKGNLPIALYVHWPFCKSKCPYCDFNSHVREAVDQAAWAQALLDELAHYAAQVGRRRLASIFFGGGTPSLMPPATVAAIIDAAAKHFDIDADIEITLEANPTSVEAEKFAGFAEAGVNRLSLGVQSLDPQALKFLGREHSATEALKAVELAQRFFSRYSFDLIYARPHQTLAQWQRELEAAMAHMGDHLSLYQLTIEPNTAFHHAYYEQKKFTLPDENRAASLYRLTGEMLASLGMQAYEVSNYARPGGESRHNLAYWLGWDYVGIGPGAHGRIGKSALIEAEGEKRGRIATRGIKSPERWLEQVKTAGHGCEEVEELDTADSAREWALMGLRLTQGLEKAFADDVIGVRFDSVVMPQKKDFYMAQGLLEETATHLRATPKGRLLLTQLTAELLF